MMTEEELELKYLRYFHAASDFGPADSDVRAMINEEFQAEIGLKVPAGYECS